MIVSFRMHVVFLWDWWQIWHWPQQHPKARCLGRKQHSASSAWTPQEGLCLLSQQLPWGCFPLSGWSGSRVLQILFSFSVSNQGGNLSSGWNQWKNPAASNRFGIFLWQHWRKDTIYLVNATQETHYHMWITVRSAVFIDWLDPLCVDGWNKVRLKKYSYFPVKTVNFAGLTAWL